MNKDKELANKIKEWLQLEMHRVCTETDGRYESAKMLLDFIKDEEKGYEQPQNNKTIRGSSLLYLMDKMEKEGE